MKTTQNINRPSRNQLEPIHSTSLLTASAAVFLKTSKQFLTVAVGAGVVLALCVAPAIGDLIQPTGAQVSSVEGGFWSAAYTIDGSGMTPSSPVTVSSTCSVSDNPVRVGWAASAENNPWISFNLGTSKTVAGFHLWNLQGGDNWVANGGYGIKLAEVYQCTSLTDPGTLVKSFTFTRAPGLTSYTGEDYSFDAPVTTQFIRIKAKTAWNNANNAPYSGINEIRFFEPAAPAGYTSWAGAGDNAFDADANNDGVDNGMAWVLGAANKEDNATSLLPTLDNTDTSYFIFNYNRLKSSPDTTIKVEYGSDLTGWTTAVHNNTTIIITPGTGAGTTDPVEVKISRTLAVGGKLFARLNVLYTP